LARHAMAIEQHYGRPMISKWGKDGVDGKLYILQLVRKRFSPGCCSGAEKYRLKQRGDVLIEGRAIGRRSASGPVRLVAERAEMGKVKAGDILVPDMTDPNWSRDEEGIGHHHQSRRGSLPCRESLRGKWVSRRSWDADMPHECSPKMRSVRFLCGRRTPVSSIGQEPF